MAKLENSLLSRALSLFPHFQLDPCEQLVPKRARDPSTPTWQPGQRLGGRVKEHDTSEMFVPGPLPVPGREIISAINLCMQVASGKVMLHVTHAHLHLNVAVHACFNKKILKYKKIKGKKVVGAFWV